MGKSGPFTAPQTGWFFGSYNFSGTGKEVSLKNETKGYSSISRLTHSGSWLAGAFVFAGKGDIISCNQSSVPINFMPAQNTENYNCIIKY